MSNIIYTEKRYHYTYWISNIKEHKHYIGVKSCNEHPKDNLGKIYFSSSEDESFMKDQKDNPENYEYRICGLFRTRKLAELDEVYQHNISNVSKNPRFYNGSNARVSGFYTCPIGTVNVRDKNGNRFRVNLDDSKYLSGEYESLHKNQVVVIDKDGLKFCVSIDDERYLSGELVGHTVGKVPMMDAYGNKYYVSKDDERIKTGELFHHMKGKIFANDTRGNYLGLVSKDDERWITGEIEYVKKKGYTIERKRDTWDYKDKDGNIVYAERDDYRVLNGELVGRMKGVPNSCKGTIPAKDLNGNSLGRILKEDGRWKTGEIIQSNVGVKHKKKK